MLDQGTYPSEQMHPVGHKPETFSLKAVRDPPVPPDVSKKCCETMSVLSQYVFISVFLLGGLQIRVQLQALHLMVMALPDANRDTAQVCPFRCHGLSSEALSAQRKK